MVYTGYYPVDWSVIFNSIFEGEKKMIKKIFVIEIVIVFLIGSFASGFTINLNDKV